MWVFDGEQWMQDDGGIEQSSTPKPQPRQQRPAELVPELQVVEIEIVQQVPRTTHVPPFPLP